MKFADQWRYKWTLVALLWVVALLNYLDRQVLFAVFPLLTADLHVSSVQLGFLSTSFLWVYALLSPFGGYVADRFGRRRVILASLIVWSAVTWLTGEARSYGELVIARGLMGISEACYLPAALAMIADYHGVATRSRAVGLHQSGLYAGIVLGGFGGGWMGDRFGWRTAFLVLGVVGLAYGGILFFGLKESPQQSEKASGSDEQPPFASAVRELLASGRFLTLLAGKQPGLGGLLVRLYMVGSLPVSAVPDELDRGGLFLHVLYPSGIVCRDYFRGMAGGPLDPNRTRREEF